MLSIGVWLVAMIVIQPLLLWVSCLIVRVKGVRVRRIYLAYLAMLGMNWVWIGISIWVTNSVLLVSLGLLGISAQLLALRKLLGVGLGRATGCFFLSMALMTGIVLLIRATTVEAFLLPTASMSPTLLAGDRIMVDKVTLHFRQPQRGDVVLYSHVEKSAKYTYVKRVFAIAGDKLELQGDMVVLNGQPSLVRKLDTRVPNTPKLEYPLVIPEGKMFVVGDNAELSLDSRITGCADVASIVGLADIIYASAVMPDRFPGLMPRSDDQRKPGTIRWERIGKIVR